MAGASFGPSRAPPRDLAYCPYPGVVPKASFNVLFPIRNRAQPPIVSAAFGLAMEACSRNFLQPAQPVRRAVGGRAKSETALAGVFKIRSRAIGAEFTKAWP